MSAAWSSSATTCSWSHARLRERVEAYLLGKTVVACAATPDGQRVRSFGTTTRELRALADWLTAQGVTHVAMESTSVVRVQPLLA